MGTKILILSAYLGDSPNYLNDVIKNHKQYASTHKYEYEFVTNLKLVRVSPDDFTNYCWAKVQAVKDKLNDFSHIFWIDADSIFIDFQRDLSDLINMNTQLVFTGDSYDVFNTGHFLIKSSDWSQDYLNEWLEMRKVRFPEIKSSHQDDYGYLADQPAANILLRRGLKCEEPMDSSQFNWMNGYIGNKKRKLKYFHLFVSPIRRTNLIFTQYLIHRSIRANIKIVIQDRLNGYPFKLPGYRSSKRPKIMHFPGDTKNQISSHLRMVK